MGLLSGIFYKNAKVEDVVVQQTPPALVMFINEYHRFAIYVDVILFSLACREIRYLLRPFIENNYTFRYVVGKSVFQQLKPKKMIATLIENLPEYVTQLILSSMILPSLPPTLTRLTFTEAFNSPLKPQVLPPTLTHLVFTMIYRHPLNSFNLPPTLTHLYLFWTTPPIENIESPYFWSVCPTTISKYRMRGYNHPLDDLPPSLTTLFVSLEFNGGNSPGTLDNLPRSLTTLCIYIPTSILDFGLDHLPQSLTHLYIYGTLQSPLDYLPQSLTHLLVPSYPDLHLDYLPPSLTRLVLSSYNHRLNYLPPTLTRLTLVDSPVKLPYLPSSLTHLTLQKCGLGLKLHYFHQLPPNLVQLVFEQQIFDIGLDALPASLRILQIPYCHSHVDHLPPALTKLYLCFDFDIQVDYLPTTITYLAFGGYFAESIDYLPSSITHLELPYQEYKHPIDNLPPSLLYLTFPQRKPYTLGVDHLPPSVTHIYEFPSSRTYYLPDSVTYLAFNRTFTGLLHHLPSSLTQVMFGNDFRHPLPPLPPNLTHLNLGSKYHHPLPPHPVLTHLALGEQPKLLKYQFPSLVYLEHGPKFQMPRQDISKSIVFVKRRSVHM